jgi:ORF6N domain
MADKAKAKRSLELIPIPAIQKQIVVVRERQVMLDEDLADLYGVETRRLIEQVKRNIERFPPDCMFQLTKDEAAALRSQSATPPRAFHRRRSTVPPRGTPPERYR